MRTPALLLALSVPTMAWGQECPQTVPATELQATLDAAEAAYGRVDVDAFRAAVLQARKDMPCLGEALTPAMAGQVHRLEGLSAFVDNVRERAVTAFAAARSVDPTYTFPTTVVPPGNPLLDQYNAREPLCETESMPRPSEGTLRLDGKDIRARPLDFPVLVQVIEANGQPGKTAYLWPGDAVPYEAGRGGSPLKTALLVSGSSLAAVGLGTLIVGSVTNPSGAANLDEGFSAVNRNNVLTGTGMTLLVGGLSGVGVSFALPTRRDR